MNTQTTTQLRVTVPNLPGELAKITSMLLKGKVNITGLMTECLGDVSYVRLLASPEKAATDLLEHAGFDVMGVPVFEIDVANRPGRLNRLAKELAEQNVNILCVYGTGAGSKARLILAVDEVEKAGPIIDKWANEEASPKGRDIKH